MNGKSNLIEFAKNYWIILIFIGGLIITWTQFEYRLKDIEGKIITQENKSQDFNLAIAEINTRLAEIQTTLRFIEQKFDNRGI